MATAAMLSSLRRRRSLSLEAFLAPVDLSEVDLVQTLATVAAELVADFSAKVFFFQRRNSRSLIRTIKVFLDLLDYLKDSGSYDLPSKAVLCLKELYPLLYCSKILLNNCAQSSKLWLLLQNHSISGHFHELNREISALLDVFPLNDVVLSEDIREEVELMHRQAMRSSLFIDKDDESLRILFFGLLDEFESGTLPNEKELTLFFVERLGIRDAKSCRVEIEFLEEQIVNHEGDVEPTVSVLNGFVAITRYSRFLLFEFEEDDQVRLEIVGSVKRQRKGLITQEIAEAFVTVPTDFSCPIWLDVMQDPVMISTGHTYDRSSVASLMKKGFGRFNCPKTREMVVDTWLVPNRALRNLIMRWCLALEVPYDPPESMDGSVKSFSVAAAPTRAAVVATRTTTTLLIQQLTNGSQRAKTVAACEIRLLSRDGNEYRALIAEAGAIPHLCKIISCTFIYSCLRQLFSSMITVVQENAVTAMLNLSIHEKNKSRIMDVEGCLEVIVEVFRFGLTTEARENAGAILFSLSSVHDYKKRIADEKGAVEALAGLLREGTPRGRKDAVSALFNLSTHKQNCVRMIEAGAVAVLIGALGNEGVAEEAAGALALIVRQPVGAEAVGKEEMAVAGLIAMMPCGTPRGQENAVAALLELCRSGGVAATERVVKAAPELAGLLPTLLFKGTKRARRKAASLARVFKRCEDLSLHFGGLGLGYAFASNSAANRDSSFASDVLEPFSFSVPFPEL